MTVAVKVESCPTCSFKPKVDKFTEMCNNMFGDKMEIASEDGGGKGMCVISIGDDVVFEKKGKGKGKGKHKDKGKHEDKGKGKHKANDEWGEEGDRGKGKGKDKAKDNDNYVEAGTDKGK